MKLVWKCSDSASVESGKEAKRCRSGRGRVLMGRQQLGAGAGSTRGLIVALA